MSFDADARALRSGGRQPSVAALARDVVSLKLDMDFIIESGLHSTHVINATSAAFMSAFEFAKLVADTVQSHDDPMLVEFCKISLPLPFHQYYGDMTTARLSALPVHGPARQKGFTLQSCMW